MKKQAHKKKEATESARSSIRKSETMKTLGQSRTQNQLATLLKVQSSASHASLR